jgi:bifunctional DNA-binding transcriptional regulator/antitoxin component of YhaV-PrlF toxin-antitoxin module
MLLVVREEGLVPIPEDLADRFGIHEGSRIEWVLTDDGRLTLQAANLRAEAIRKLRGSLKDTVKSGDLGMRDFLEWRENERRLDDTY